MENYTQQIIAIRKIIKSKTKLEIVQLFYI